MSKKKLPYRVIESNKIYEGHVIQLFKDRLTLNKSKDKIITRELVAHPGAVVILPFLNKGQILLIKQFRYAAKGDLWEIPAGTREKNEVPSSCAKRELEEETGFKAKRWTFLTKFLPAPGVTDELMWLYKAENLVKGRLNLDHDEFIETHMISVKKALAMILNGSIQDGKTILAILWANFL